MKTVTSWLETTRMVGDAWQNNSVPPAYATRTLQTAQENLKQEETAINSLSISDALKSDLITKLRELEKQLGQAAAAIENNNRSAFTLAINQLTTQEQALISTDKGLPATT